MPPKQYKHIFFDLDHTLWDFEKNASETLRHLFNHFNFQQLKLFTLEQFLQAFHKVNRQLWSAFDNGKVDKSYIRAERFKIVSEQLKVSSDLFPAQLGELYLAQCPSKAHVMPFAHDILNYLKQNYVLHVITNGFNDVQLIKIESSRLTDFFHEIITADSCGYQKPHKQIFDHALKAADADHHECIMIGDNLATDIKGAKNAGIDQIFYNPYNLSYNERVTYEINCLSELKQIL
jgi:putative hydrolase of the HAD superfamily